MKYKLQMFISSLFLLIFIGIFNTNVKAQYYPANKKRIVKISDTANYEIQALKAYNRKNTIGTTLYLSGVGIIAFDVVYSNTMHPCMSKNQNIEFGVGFAGVISLIIGQMIMENSKNYIPENYNN